MSVPLNSWLDAYSLPLCSDEKTPHSWKEPTEMMGNFKIRCEHYVTKGHKRKGKKEPSAPRGCKLVGLFLVPAEQKIDHICYKTFNNKADQIRVAVVYQVNVKEFAQHIIFLFERDPAADAGMDPAHLAKWNALWDKCVAPGSDLMATRMKILPYLSAGANFLMEKVVNNQPGQLAEALECRQYYGDGYVEVDVDIDAYKSASIFTKLAKAAVGMVYPHVRPAQPPCLRAGRVSRG